MTEHDNLVAVNTLTLQCNTAFAQRNIPNTSVFGDTLTLYCDGFGRWYDGTVHFSGNSLTLHAQVLPVSFSTRMSGIMRLYGQKCNLSLMLDTFGHPVVRFVHDSKNRECINYGECKSFDTKLRLNERCHLMVILDGESGWIRIFVNDVETGLMQLPRGLDFEFDCIRVGRVDEDPPVNKVMPANILHGTLSDIQILPYALNDIQRAEWMETHLLHPLLPPRKEERVLFEKYKDDPNRPCFHMIATGRWMNEPHAPVFFHGWYHLFYQANPHAPVWDHLQWGHLISRDMIHWLDNGLALRTEEGSPDADGIWSGSACIDERGIPALFYTAGKFDQVPNQGIALARSTYLLDGDEKLTHWEKQRSLLIRQPHNVGRLGEFRDPFVWRQNHMWYILVGTGEKGFGGGNAAVFTSADLRDFTYHGLLMQYDFSRHPMGGHCWELPVLLPVGHGKHALLVCSCQVEHDCVEVPVWLGTFDENTCSFIPDDEEPGLIDLGYGVFTGPSGFVTPDGRSVVFTIAQGKQTGEEEYQQGWAHNGGMPVELFLHEDGALGVRPVREADTLFSSCPLQLTSQDSQVCNTGLSSVTGDCICLDLICDTDTLTWSVKTEGHELLFCYNRITGALTASQDMQTVSRPLRECDHFPCPNDPIQLRMFVDHNLIECYVNGRKSITRRLHRRAFSPMVYHVAFEGTADITIHELHAILCQNEPS